MMKANGLIIYHSKYGATEKYAQWLSEATGFSAVKTEAARIDELSEYNALVLCGGIYASGISGISYLKKNFSRLSDKKLAVLCVGASPFDEKAFNEIKTKNMAGELQSIPLFYARGAWDEERMSFKDRTLCKMLKKVVSKKDPSTLEPWMQALMEALGQKCDWTDKIYLDPLIKYLEN